MRNHSSRKTSCPAARALSTQAVWATDSRNRRAYASIWAARSGPAGTAGVGLFCEDPPSRSLFHRLEFDELWHFYAGDPLRLVLG